MFHPLAPFDSNPSPTLKLIRFTTELVGLYLRHRHTNRMRGQVVAEILAGLKLIDSTVAQSEESHLVSNRSKRRLTLGLPPRGVSNEIGASFWAGVASVTIDGLLLDGGDIEVHRYRRIAFIRGPQESFTAEERYVDAIQALQARHIRAPDDIAGVGFDDLEMGPQN